MVAAHIEVLDQVREIPNQKIAVAQEKLKQFKALKGEIGYHMMIILEQINLIKEKIYMNINTGLLKYSE